MFDRSVYETYVTEGDGIPLDLIVWRRYRRQTPGLVEAILDMNYGLADQGPLLARGTTIKIPIDQPATPAQVALRRLW
jgi:phage tail protein X